MVESRRDLGQSSCLLNFHTRLSHLITDSPIMLWRIIIPFHSISIPVPLCHFIR